MSLAWFAPLRRSCGAKEIILAWLSLSLLFPFLRDTFIAVGVPAPSEVIFGFAPSLALCLVVCVVVLVIGNRQRWEQAAAQAVVLVAAAGLFSLILSLTAVWSDGSAYFILRPAQALGSMLTLGFWPAPVGPDALIRFLPLGTALGLVWKLYRLRFASRRVFASAAAAYLILAFFLHVLSWIAGALAWLKGTSLESIDDIFRVLITAQSGGYWINGQAQRFLAPLGQQAGTGLLAAHAAMLFLGSFCLLAILFFKRLAGARQLMRRLLTAECFAWFALIATGLGLGYTLQSTDTSYTFWVSLALVCCLTLAWVLRWRLVKDLEHVPQDEVENPHLPLPSGAVPPHEVEELNALLLVLALFAAALLGWPVFVGVALAASLSWMVSRSGLGWGSGALLERTIMVMSFSALGWAGLMFGLRNALPSTWMVNLLLAAALLASLGGLTNELRRQTSAKKVILLLPSTGLFIAALIMRQPLLWGLGLLAILSQLALGWKIELWRKFGAWPAYLLLTFTALLSLLLPQLLNHY